MTMMMERAWQFVMTLSLDEAHDEKRPLDDDESIGDGRQKLIEKEEHDKQEAEDQKEGGDKQANEQDEKDGKKEKEKEEPEQKGQEEKIEIKAAVPADFAARAHRLLKVNPHIHTSPSLPSPLVRLCSTVAWQDKLGFDTFRPLQLEALYSICSGKDTVLALGTGGGKTVPGILPHFLLGGTVINVCPLLALMDDQIRSLRAFATAGGYTLRIKKISTDKPDKETLKKLAEGSYDFVFLAPEALTASVRAALEALRGINKLAAVIFDEVHCVSLWGQTFRSAYLNAGMFKASSVLAKVPLLVCSSLRTRVPHSAATHGYPPRSLS